MNRWIACAGALLVAACAPAGPASGPAPASAPTAAAGSGSWPPARPIPYPVTVSPGFQQAVASGTRTGTGRPGSRYWTNGASYRIRVQLFPDDKRLDGTETVRYYNRSPDTLRALVVDLTQNIHAPGAVRLEPAEVTGGVKLARVVVGGETLQGDQPRGPRYVVDGTKLYLFPSNPVQPRDSVDLAIDWSFTIPKQGAGGRMGYDTDLFFLAYFYPQVAVYDDVEGWATDQFLSPGEFYGDFARYQVDLVVPAGWVVTGTGELTNAANVFSAPVLARIAAAERSDSVVHVLTAADFDRATRTSSGSLTWSFRADSVHDVAFGITRRSLWDATRTSVGDRTGDGQPDYARVDALYREPAVRWRSAARYAQQSIRAHSEFTGLPYAWSHMTAVEGDGIIGGGMEYPMMTLIGAYTTASDTALYGVVSHELAHMWVPMMVASDERRFGWLDEGTTDFNEMEATKSMYPGTHPEPGERDRYLRWALQGEDGPLMRRSDYQYPGAAFVVSSYYKPATILVALRGLLGEETFVRAYREFFDRWAYRHPYPWDLWNTFDDVSGRDLGWFWRTWYFETWLLDQSVGSVTAQGDSTRIVVEDHGNAPMPARLTITLASGDTLKREVPVESWLRGARSATVTVPGRATRVEIDAENVFPDADRENNVWTGTQ
jgi:hypothetical protein